MDLKERIKREIDLIPEEYLPQVEQYLELVRSGRLEKRRIKTLHLKGRFDTVHIRRAAYE